MQKRWETNPPITAQAEKALSKFPPVLRQILYNRGYATDEEARAFLNRAVPIDTNPFLLLDMEAAIERIRYALEHGEPIAVYGDYDVDGVTSTALLVQVLNALGGDARPYIPNRFDEGYGLNLAALDSLAADGVRLVITVDCGIRSLEEAEHARGIGLDLIVTDHHHPGDSLPNALAVINPKRPGDPYPEKDLAGVGIAYKIAEALYQRLRPKTLPVESYLDFVALGTVADLAPLTGEIRALVQRGLREIRRGTRQGIVSLAGVADLSLPKTTAADIGFRLGPRLNAAGRLDEAIAAYRLLVAKSVGEAAVLAQNLDNQNRQRQKLTREIQEKAEEIALREGEPPYLFFAAHPDFNAGVVGLAASRLTEKYYRPAIVCEQNEDTTRCSCRSIPEFHITEALDACADLLERHGGHAAAAGLTVRNENLPALIERLESIAEEKLASEDLRPTLIADMELPLRELTPTLLEHLRYLEPTGYGNPGALFISRGVTVAYAREVGKEKRHLKLKVTDGKITFDAIAFRMGHLRASLPSRVDLFDAFESNEWNGRVTLQLNVKDIQEA